MPSHKFQNFRRRDFMAQRREKGEDIRLVGKLRLADNTITRTIFIDSWSCQSLASLNYIFLIKVANSLWYKIKYL